MSPGQLDFTYELVFESGAKETISFALDAETLSIKALPADPLPDWTELGCQKCPCCPLDAGTSPNCPVAVNLSGVINSFSRHVSFEKVSVSIKTAARTYQKDISLQDALRSLLGLYMASSGCPILDKLRPLVRSHLPFATMEETAYRALSMYVLAQFFVQRRGGAPDWDLEGLGKLYKDVEIVNQAFHKRLETAGLADASLNAVGNLNYYAQFTNMVLKPEGLKKIENLFSSYF